MVEQFMLKYNYRANRWEYILPDGRRLCVFVEVMNDRCEREAGLPLHRVRQQEQDRIIKHLRNPFLWHPDRGDGSYIELSNGDIDLDATHPDTVAQLPPR